MPPPRVPAPREIIQAKTLNIMKRRIRNANGLKREPRWRELFATLRAGGWPESVIPLSSAMYFASCHAATSTAVP
jgi:hypothetical protein